MSLGPVIRVEGLGKRYVLERTGMARVRALMGVAKPDPSREFWALRGVNFEVARGESLGVVGRNGSGKSTLLQIIAGTLTPTEGRAEIRGRIAALLELGSGFNPHFTGRENVFMAGAILGFTAREMENKFDAIAGFADIGAFIDQPVSVYSSGMHARLAFAVAISVQPDILIIDETLSVGDAGFQQRCIGRLRSLMEQGVSLLIVSHAGEMIKSLCGRGLLLNKGRQVVFGTAAEAVDRYASVLREAGNQRALERLAATRPELAAAMGEASTPSADEPASVNVAASADNAEPEEDGATASAESASGPAGIGASRLVDEAGRVLDEGAYVKFGERLTVEAVIAATQAIDRLDVVMTVRDGVGITVFGASLWEETGRLLSLVGGEKTVVRFTFEHRLSPGGAGAVSGGKRGMYGVSLSLTRRADERGAGALSLDHRDVAAAFAALGPTAPEWGSRTVRGKVLLPVQVEVRREGGAGAGGAGSSASGVVTPPAAGAVPR